MLGKHFNKCNILLNIGKVGFSQHNNCVSRLPINCWKFFCTKMTSAVNYAEGLEKECSYFKKICIVDEALQK